MTNPTQPLLLVAGSGQYPRLLIAAARSSGVSRICLAAFHGETDPSLEPLVEETRWLRVGQLSALVQFARNSRCTNAIFAGQIAPKNLFDLRPDFRALVLLAKIKRRNAESLFSAVADEIQSAGCHVLPATTYLQDHLAPTGHFAGPKPKQRTIDDFLFGFEIAKKISQSDIGQTVIVKNGTVLAVEAFEGTNECIRRGGSLSNGKAVMVKVSKPNQDMRFDVPVIGTHTLQVASQSNISAIAIEAEKTLILDKPIVCSEANRLQITLFGISSNP
ncbi:MAG: UDP-2,3-diacylglucosamine diphosphatase LpxI [Chthoniobacterales bacterium]|nr:UDP-2,3-diacylglucosamine diphosphatase LpxI [Chthoniobacterales bacterium]